MKKITLILLMVVLSFTLAGCKPTTTTDENVVYTTVYPVQYLVESIAGETVIAKRVPGSTTGGHSDGVYWTGKDMIDMLNSDLLFYVDAGADNYIKNSIDSVFSDGDVELINISEYVTYNEVCYSHDHNDEEVTTPATETCEDNMLSDDPHFWLSPEKMLAAALTVKDQLVVMYPENSELYENNYVALQASLEKLHEDFSEMATNATKPIISTSMLFNYWHSSYEIEIISLSADAHNSEVVPGDIISFVNEAITHEIHFVLYEATTNSPNGDLVLEQLILQDPTAVPAYLHSLSNLTSEQIENGATYITLMYLNLSILNEATK